MSETFDPDQTPRSPDAPGPDAPAPAGASPFDLSGTTPPSYPSPPGVAPQPDPTPLWPTAGSIPPPPPSTPPAGAAPSGSEGPAGVWVPPGSGSSPGSPQPWDHQTFWGAPGQWGGPGQWGSGQWAPPPGGWPPPPGGWAPPPPPSRPHPLRVVAVVVAVLLVAAIGVETGRVTSTDNTNNANGQNSSSLSTPQGPSSPANSSTIADKIDPGVVDVNTELGYDNGEAAGTGMVISSSGLVLTNNHVIDGATSISVTDVGNGQTYTASVVGSDSASDVAVLRLANASGLKTVPLGDSSSVSVGDSVTAVGNAEGAGGVPSTAAGSVTALDQAITAQDESENSSEQLSGLIQTDANLEPGDSGGPLVNSQGKVVGMDTAASSGFQFQAGASQGFSIPINQAITIAHQITAGKSSNNVHLGASALLGVRITDGTYISGAQVVTVQPGTPADQVGIVAGDVITGLGGAAVDSASSLSTAMQQHHPNDLVKVVWVDTSGQQHSAQVHLATGPAT